MNARYKEYVLQFKVPAGTSRGTLISKPSYFIIVEDNGFTGIGECSLIPGLSPDYEHPGYVEKLLEVCKALEYGLSPVFIDLSAFPSIAFGLETALLDLKAKGSNVLFLSKFSKGEEGIPINGLVWMGSRDFMQKQIREKIDSGYHCIKLKIGALDFDTELNILKDIRKQYAHLDLEIRLDANGAFSITQALDKLQKLSKYYIHSIEQPIQSGIFEEMTQLCAKSPIPIALDEELIGVSSKNKLLQMIRPAYIILKPSLIGGFRHTDEWISFAEHNNIGWWATSALESNIGLNAIAQWLAQKYTTLPQGLGTGSLYTNNISSPLYIQNAHLHYNPYVKFDFKALLQ